MLRENSPRYEPSSEPDTKNLVEANNNVLPFVPREKVEHAVEHIKGEVGTHKRSMYELGELGFSSLDDAKEGLSDLRQEKQDLLDNLNKHVRFSVVGKLKDRIFNQGIEVNKLIEIENKIHKLESAVRFTQLTKGQDEQEISGEQPQEFKRAA